MIVYTKEEAIVVLSGITVLLSTSYKQYPPKYQELVRARSVKIQMSIIDKILNEFPDLESEFHDTIELIRGAFNHQGL